MTTRPSPAGAFLVLLTLVLAVATFVTLPLARADEAADGAVPFETGTPPFADVLAKAKAAGKAVFLDFSTEWCGWCRRLEKDTFSQAKVGEVMQGFVSVHVDAERGEGPDLAKRYGVSGFPTLVVVDANGDEVDRVVGYLAPEPFVAEMERILSGEGTLPALRKALADAPDDIEAGLRLASKLSTSKPGEAAAVFDALMQKAKKVDRALEARVLLERGRGLLATNRSEEALATAERLLRDFVGTPAAADAAARLGHACLRADVERALAFLAAARAQAETQDARMAVEKLEIAVHDRAIAAALRRQAEATGDDARGLNQIAWTCFERKVNLREAIVWARRAVELSDRDPMVLDTLANLLALLGRGEEAVPLEEEAVAKAEGGLRAELQRTLERMRAEHEARTGGGDVIPAVPLLPPAEK